jgi:transposase
MAPVPQGNHGRKLIDGDGKQGNIPPKALVFLKQERASHPHRQCCTHQRSFGIARGKKDRIDSICLCNYAVRQSDTLKAKPAFDPGLLHLKDFISIRTKLHRQLNGLRTLVRKLKSVNQKSPQKLLSRSLRSIIEGIAKSIKSIETEIKSIIAENAAFKKTCRLLLSIPGIGHLAAVYLIGCTANFAGSPGGKQLARYAGVVPFEHPRGISIKGRLKVHRMANKELKRLLHLGAMSTKQHNREFSIYYNSKKDEGKHNISILNAIKKQNSIMGSGGHQGANQVSE